MNTRAFLLNDRLVDVDVPDGTLALGWLRERHGLVGVKEGCGEGECGACAVLLGEREGDVVAYRAVTSCLLAVGELPGRHLVTIEGLNPAQGLNPVQQYLVDAGAPQCGFCFPGFVVSLTGYFLNSPDLARDDAIAAVDGNICRCTGYASILRAVDAMRARFGPLLDAKRRRVTQLVEWGVLPAHFREAASRLAPLPAPVRGAAGATLMGGGTDLLVQKAEALADANLDFLSRRPALREIRHEGGYLVIGGGVTVESLKHDPLFRACVPDAVGVIDRFASTVIRNRATVAGNLINASPIGDVTILLLALGAEILFSRGRVVRLRDFYLGYKELDLNPGETVEAVRVSWPGPDDRMSFEKVSPRRYLDIASVNSALRARVQDGIWHNVALAVGGVAPVPLLARATSACLEGRPVDAARLREAADCLDGEIAPIDDVRGTATYKRLLARRLLFAHGLKLARVRYEELV
jgi:xanthine dehydrogenase small subunit